MAKKLKKSMAEAAIAINHEGKGSTVEAVRNMAKTLSPMQGFELSAALRTACNARANPFAHAKARLFNRITGEEIISGDCYNFFKHPTKELPFGQWLKTIITWKHLSGERFLLADESDGLELIPLNPFSMEIANPNAMRIRDITGWRYHWQNGIMKSYNSDAIIFSRNFSSASDVRGQCPALAVINQIGASYQAVRFIKDFFSNNAQPSRIITLPPGCTKEQKNAYADEFYRRYSIYGGMAFTDMITSGEEIKITPLDSPFKDLAAEMGPIFEHERRAIFSLYSVPPLHSGEWDKTRFDSTEEQNAYFFESVVLPDAEEETEFLQHYIINRFFALETGYKTVKSQVSKALKNKIDIAAANSESDIVLVLDMDGIPSVAALKRKKLTYVKSMCDTLRISPAMACRDLGIDCELGAESEFVWHANSDTYVGADKNAVILPEEPKAPMVEENDGAEVDSEAEPDPEVTKAIVRTYHDLRQLVLKAQRPFSLEEARTIAKGHNCLTEALNKQLAADYIDLLRIFKRKSDPKVLFKKFTKRFCRGLS